MRVVYAYARQNERDDVDNDDGDDDNDHNVMRARKIYAPAHI